MGRHYPTESKGRHYPTERRRGRSSVVLFSMLLVVVLVAWFIFDILRDQLNTAGCDSRTVVTVTAAPDIAPVVTQVGRRVSEEGGEGCYQVRVSSRESAEVAESVAVSDGTERPDVWVPESTLSLRRGQEAGGWNTAVTGTSIASSPAVLAVAESEASELGWPDKSLAWEQVIGPGSASDKGALTVGFPDPVRDPVGAATLFGLQELVKTAPKSASTVALRALSANTVAKRSELVARLPGAARSDKPLAAFPTSEHDVLRHNERPKGSPLVAVYPDPQVESVVPALDYPYVVLPETPNDEREAAEKFLDRLLDRDTTKALGDAGFRSPDGKALRDEPRDRRTIADSITSAPIPKAQDVEGVLNTWAAINLTGRLQVLLDVSGSMNEQVPGTGKTRMQATIEAAVAGIGLFGPNTKMGLWLYSTHLDGDRDYRELLPVLPLGEHLATGVVEKLRAVRAEAANTALYDAILAAYRDSTQDWEAGRMNTVVVMTDGQDDNDSDITRAQLLDELRKLQNPRRPLKLIGIGIGPDVNAAELTALTKVTGGQAFVAPDPSKIGDVFYSALSLMLCQPPTCQPDTTGGG
ncbi:MAG: substrate-binding and VWA domain-containing protein [Actinophytocola sp.]|uniref:substrate-binding and VWA domain-containing protein n=1 Tax=Actinophytocola sp. TaxID=1872138 RepID=UPI003D6BF2D1